jgi:hypothetical protein
MSTQKDPKPTNDGLRATLLALYQENTTHGRHHETQRSTVAAILLTITAGVVSVVTYDRTLNLFDIPLTAFVIVLGIFGVIFSRTHYTLYRMHMDRAAAFRDALGDHLGTGLKAIKQKADARSIRVQTAFRLNYLWTFLYALIAVLATILTISAAVLNQQPAATPRCATTFPND